MDVENELFHQVNYNIKFWIALERFTLLCWPFGIFKNPTLCVFVFN